MKLIKKVEGNEKYKNHNGVEVVYMPYGEQGSGYYKKDKT